MEISDEEYVNFCNTYGVEMDVDCLYDFGYEEIISVLQDHDDSLEEFLPYYMFLLIV